jgi:3-hydroxyacyl-CoA dehydrogenase/3a,7a,12a-trihydroxy-5b-cholest-24-enoyl-CoA hydratase
MASDLRFDGRVVIVTGAGNGLGRSHALLFASRGAKVVVNDLGGKHDGSGQGSAAADKVVEEIKAAGGTAVANYDSVEDGDRIVKTATDAFGRVDVVVNNAGILRDGSFQKMTQDSWDIIYRVHVLGAYRVTKAAWDIMREQGFGRVIFTTSAAGLYGNFGQSNYAMAKLGLVGLTQTLAIEGLKKNVLVNAIAPIAGSRMTETVLPANLVDALKPEYVSPLVAWLSHESCKENGGVFEVGGGFCSKLRWERTAGKTFKLGRPISIENVVGAWDEITSFSKSTHPADITASMGPILANLGTKSRGANEFLDADVALAADIPTSTNSYTERDLALYALGVGAAENPLDAQDLGLVYEMNSEGFHALPTFSVAPALNVLFDIYRRGENVPGLHYGLDRILHGEQYTEILNPWPSHAKLSHKMKIKDIWDKGSNAVVVTAVTTNNADTGEPLAYNEITSVVRGAGNFGGDRGPSTDVNVPPDRAPDATIVEKTHENQALLYRLSGDINPLHADPTFAQNFGFPKPILHGLCTYGFAARAVLKAFGKNDPRLFKSIKARFSGSVFPGETLITEMWKESDTRIVFRTKVKERDKAAISNAAVELYAEVPAAKAKPAAKVATASAADATPVSADIFTAMGGYLAANAADAKKIGITYQFKLTAPDSTWTVDTKTATVTKGETAQPECTLTLSESDFMAMATGKADAMKLFMDKKLRIGGNVMASQKLDFLKKIDPANVAAAAKARVGAVPAAAPAVAEATPAAAPATAERNSTDVFTVIADHVAKNPDLKKIGIVYLFKLTGPDSTWTLNLKDGVVGAGELAKPECTLTLSDADFLDMVNGKADAMKLFMDKKLRIGGNVMASQKLDFLRKIDAEAAKQALAKKGAAAPVASPKSEAPAAKAGGLAATIFTGLSKRLAENPSLAREVGAVLQFNVDGKSWVLDLASVPGSVREGTDAKAAAVLTISDADLVALSKGEESAKSLYQHGQLQVAGDVRLAHNLGLLNKLV